MFGSTQGGVTGVSDGIWLLSTASGKGGYPSGPNVITRVLTHQRGRQENVRVSKLGRIRAIADFEIGRCHEPRNMDNF